MVTNDWEQVHEASGDIPQRHREGRRCRRHLLDAPALETGVVRDHGSDALACPDQALCERRSRIFGPTGEPLVVSDAAIRLLNVAAELDRRRVVWMATLPHGDGKAH